MYTGRAGCGFVEALCIEYLPNPDKPEPNPNSEIRDTKQIQLTKGENSKRIWQKMLFEIPEQFYF
jgi:hypothetical protein